MMRRWYSWSIRTCRENILPIERAFAYKMKLEAMKRQGERTDLQEDETSAQVGRKLETAELIGHDHIDCLLN